jgi:hypothetical protein
MVLIADGKHFAAHFRHTNENGRWSTFATVHVGPCYLKARPCETEPSVTGVAHCAPQDGFNKSTGRKIALARALKDVPRDTRRQLWASYFEHFKKPVEAKDVIATVEQFRDSLQGSQGR